MSDCFIQSPVMSSCFAEFHPNLVVGGTYSGQIVLWDNRVNKRTPIQRTPLSAAAHTVTPLSLSLCVSISFHLSLSRLFLLSFSLSISLSHYFYLSFSLSLYLYMQ